MSGIDSRMPAAIFRIDSGYIVKSAEERTTPLEMLGPILVVPFVFGEDSIGRWTAVRRFEGVVVLRLSNRQRRRGREGKGLTWTRALNFVIFGYNPLSSEPST